MSAQLKLLSCNALVALKRDAKINNGEDVKWIVITIISLIVIVLDTFFFHGMILKEWIKADMPQFANIMAAVLIFGVIWACIISRIIKARKLLDAYKKGN